ncbi:transposase IS66 [Photobacterium leiognathi lrivu.4.1]|uniref:Transposase IS66 n=1 Tax=Photobacterium leiognathi lrivu.4.1 TaxID=1248232 RepID=V5FA74_PHOLE|nr:transposase IS66 [Photobacterium leiognathi lrivu.4.1]
MILSVIKEDKQCYMWQYCSGVDSPDAVLANVKNIVLYDYQNSRSKVCPVTFLGDYGGYLHG